MLVCIIETLPGEESCSGMVLDWFQMQDRQRFVDAVLLIVMMHIEEEYNPSAAAAAAAVESYGC